MNRVNNQTYLRLVQYSTDANLQARIRLHEQYSINNLDLHVWVFNHLQLPTSCRILEVGCGPGMLWRKNLDRIHPEWRVCLVDFSPGMMRTAQSHILPVHPHFTTAGLDIQHIPFSEASFDVIIADHMLYHVPDHPKAFGEIRRLLKPGGRFYASTNGQTHLQEMGELVTRFNPKYNNWGNRISTMSFTLENGLDQLKSYFTLVTLHRYDDGLVVTKAEPLADFINSLLKMEPWN